MTDQLVEEALLGCILYKPEIIKNIKASTEDFEDNRTRDVYEVMLKFQEDGVNIDPVAISNELKDPKAVSYLTDLYINTLIWENYKVFDAQIRNRAAKKKALILSKVIMKMAQNGSSAEEIVIKMKEATTTILSKIEGQKSLSDQIDDWIASISGTFFVTECDKDIGIVTKRDKGNRRQIFNRLERKGRIAKASHKQGHYRVVESNVEVINFREANSNEDFPIRWPFNLQDYVRILPKSIIVVAGAWEAGKTAFLLNVARMNQNQHHVRYMSSEMGDAEFRLRLDLFVDMAPDDWKIEAIERSSDYEDAILPDALNIIDYLEISDNFFLIGEKIRRIYDRLKKGVAVIAIQKATGMELARGGDFSAEKARLYLRLDQGELEIMKGKLWANPQVSPRNTVFPFKLWQGHKFVANGEPYKKTKQQKDK